MVGRFTKDADLARKDRCRNEVSRNGTHLFAEARHLARGDSERRLGRDVAARGARTARRQNEIAPDDVHELAKRLFDVEALVGNEALMDADRRRDGLAAPSFERRDAFVVIDAAASAVGDGN